MPTQKQVASPASTGDRGGAFERRVQASRLLAMCLGLSCPGVPRGFDIVRLQFQGRLLGHNTDDLVIFSLCPETGLEATIRMQMKRTLTTGSVEFKEAIGSAWLDFNSSLFNKKLDEIQIVFDSSSLSTMKGALEVINFARSSLTQAVWRQKIDAKNFSNDKIRKAYFVMELAVQSYDSESIIDGRFHSFVKSLKLLGETLDSNEAAGVEHHKQLICQQLPQFDKNAVWARLVTACTELNGVAGEIALSNLYLYIPELVNDFGVARLLRRVMSSSSTGENPQIKDDPYYKKLLEKLSSLNPTATHAELPLSLVTRKEKFAGGKLSQAIKKISENQEMDDLSTIPPILRAQNRRALTLNQLTNDSIGQILDHWFKDHEYVADSQQRFFIQEFQCELLAADLEKGELSEESVETTAHATIVAITGKAPLLKNEYKLSVWGHGHDELEILWRLSFNLPEQQGYFARRRDFRSSHYIGEYLRRNLVAYEKVLAKILGGWKPVIRLGLPWSNGERYHRDVGLISNLPHNEEIMEMYRRIKVTNLLISLGEQHGIPLRLSSAALDNMLTEKKIADAVHDLAKYCKPFPPMNYRSVAYAQGENWEICMIAKPFFIGFQKFNLDILPAKPNLLNG
ncbi:hypothetical protein [Pseudomonas sp. Irchel s3a12]|uniref:hypothetical protein n=1 Tax=Pseudomonas sp. Irchel s3a12 TaxID=2009047 RepID=UPI00113FFC7B|nr:hypothetical protein [Pseudomonas sp. Irchel s3a12]